VFDNKDKNLWPGQFADVTLTLAQQDNALTVPSQAVQTGPEGGYVYVIRPDMTVEQRKVSVDRSEGAETVIRDGLRADEKIVLDGQLRLKPGVKVVSKPAP
jgi:multidrug efflux system membrane fusion protein